MTLDKLPKNHKHRNMPLSGFYYKWKHGSVWLEIKPSFAIAKNTYNELGSAWTDNDIFIKAQ
jgi:hypothetical protein